MIVLNRRAFLDGALAALGLLFIVVLPFVEIAAANADVGLHMPKLFWHFSVAVGLAFAIVLATRVLWRRIPFWRIAVAFAPVAFLFFEYEEINLLLGIGDGFPPLGREGEEDVFERFPSVLTVWAAALLAIFCLGVYGIRDRRAVYCLLLTGALLLVQPCWTYASKSNQRTLKDKTISLKEYFLGSPPREHPNIYWLVADGYPRADVLAKDFDFDNSAFLGTLRDLGFTLPGGVWANYSATLHSTASIVEMQYLVDGKSKPGEVKNLARFRRFVGGDNQVVSSLRSLGYRTVHFANGYDFGTQCGGLEDRCLKGNRGLDEIDINTLRRTPVLAAMAWRAYWWPSRESMDPLFYWRAFDALEEALPDIRETVPPFFLYAHIVAPHPPLRFDARCAYRAASPDLKVWDAGRRSLFVDQVRCVNAQLERLLRIIVRRDPTALIVLNADHGSAFRGSLDANPERLDRKQVRERMAPLAALRVPEKCREGARKLGSLVNLFRVVLGCLAGKDMPLLGTQVYFVPYDDQPMFGRVYPYEVKWIKGAS